MSTALLYMLCGTVMVAIGIYHALIALDPLRRILSANILGSGVFLFLVALAHRQPDAPPDPVPHAMVLTGLVVAVSATALLLSLHVTIHNAGQNESGEPGR